ncbi:MAG: ribosome recycling factor [Candidatus Paceibacterota bacterium]|jgi:ribosome recycling factor
MAYNFAGFKIGAKGVEDWLVNEHGSIRTGRATPALLDSVLVDSYGSKMPVSNVAAIAVEDPKTLRITPWDASLVKAIETGIASANLGVSTSPDNKSIRVIFPELTVDRRKLLMKLAGEKLEEAKISLRAEREKIWNDIQKQEKEGTVTEDEKFRYKDELQKMVDDTVAKLEQLHERKRKEIEL